jgi:short-subunit dehydrogenase
MTTIMSKDEAKTALITGASSGIGREFAKLFAKDGYDLIIIALPEDRLRELADSLNRE